MKTFNVKKTLRGENGFPMKTEIIGIITAYTYTEAMRKAAKKYNNDNWANISVSLLKTKKDANNI